MSNSTRKFTLVVTGNTDSAYEDALAEALNRIRSGELCGADRNDSGAFYFDSTDKVPEGEQPLM